MRSLRALMAANSRCTHIVAAMPHPKPTTNIVIPLASPPERSSSKVRVTAPSARHLREAAERDIVRVTTEAIEQLSEPMEAAAAHKLALYLDDELLLTITPR
jgi:hypothetical protein